MWKTLNNPENEFVDTLDEDLSSHAVLTFYLAPEINEEGTKEGEDEALEVLDEECIHTLPRDEVREKCNSFPSF
jgi:hypothetical protein